jgi:hypothetical protein
VRIRTGCYYSVTIHRRLISGEQNLLATGERIFVFSSILHHSYQATLTERQHSRKYQLVGERRRVLFIPESSISTRRQLASFVCHRRLPSISDEAAAHSAADRRRDSATRTVTSQPSPDMDSGPRVLASAVAGPSPADRF